MSVRRLPGVAWLGGRADATVRLVHERTSRLGGPTQLAALRWLLLVAGVPSDLRALLDRARRRQRPEIVQLVEHAAARQQQHEQEGQQEGQQGQEMAAKRCTWWVTGLLVQLTDAASCLGYRFRTVKPRFMRLLHHCDIICIFRYAKRRR